MEDTEGTTCVLPWPMANEFNFWSSSKAFFVPFRCLLSDSLSVDSDSDPLSLSDSWNGRPLLPVVTLFFANLYKTRPPQKRKQQPQTQHIIRENKTHPHHGHPPSSQGQWKANQFHSHGSKVNLAPSSLDVKVPSFSGHRCKIYSPSITDFANWLFLFTSLEVSGYGTACMGGSSTKHPSVML